MKMIGSVQDEYNNAYIAMQMKWSIQCKINIIIHVMQYNGNDW